MIKNESLYKTESIQADVLNKIKEHPLEMQELVDAVLLAWKGLLESKIGNKQNRIGVDLFLKPQLIGSLLHELIPIEIMSMYPNAWRIDAFKLDKDVEFLNNKDYSIEIKTSSSRTSIFGNRSYTKTDGLGKRRGTYLLTVNFDKLEPGKDAGIQLIRFGYVEQSDWISQVSETGQQCRLSKETYQSKLLEIYNHKE